MARVCPACRALNGDSETRCYRCGKPFPGPVTAKLASLSGDFIVTRGLVLFCLVVFALAVAVDGNLPLAPELNLGRQFRGSTLLRFGLLYMPLVESEPWRLLSAVFLHFSVLHIAFNMWALVGLGRPLEQRFGWARALLIFLLSGVFGFMASAWWYGVHSGIPTCGASGGIFGQLGAVIGLLVARRHPDWKSLAFNNLILALIIGIAAPVNTSAHLGGFVFGFGLGYGFERERVRPVTTWVLSLLALFGALLSVGSIVASMLSPVWKSERQGEQSQEL